MWLVCTHGPMNSCGVDRPSYFFKIYTVQRRRSQHARTFTPMNTRTQTLPL
jgi:hypothetical protein